MNLFLRSNWEVFLMDSIKTIIITAVIIWVLQTLFGLFQVRNFKRNFVEMRKEGKVVIGFNKGLFFSGTVVLIRIDDSTNIEEIRYMQGVTVLAKFKKLEGLEDKNLLGLQEKDLKGLNKLTRKAVYKAIENYEKFIGGEKEEEAIKVENSELEQQI